MRRVYLKKNVRRKVGSIKYYERFCIFALFIKQAERVRVTRLSAVTCQSVLYFYTLSRKRCDFWKKVTEKKYVF
jgi:hypothetical protein